MRDCTGLLGRIFGHRFTSRIWHNGGNPYCDRCGYEPKMSHPGVTEVTHVPDPCAGCSGCSRCYDADEPR